MATAVGQRAPGIGLSSHVELWTRAIVPDLFLHLFFKLIIGLVKRIGW